MFGKKMLGAHLSRQIIHTQQKKTQDVAQQIHTQQATKNVSISDRNVFIHQQAENSRDLSCI
jgi:hypothetical protein